MSLPIPSFIERDSDKIVSETKAYFESLSGKTVQPGQPEMMLINTWAYRELLLRSAFQSSMLQMLVAYASAPSLDYLAEQVSVIRIPAVPAQCTLLFTLVEGHAEVTIPAGTRVQSADGMVIFETDIDVVIEEGTDSVEIEATCTSDGIIGNGYLAGEISSQLDPYAYVESAENTATTAAGADQETDDELRERIKLAPNSFSVAGPTAAYIYFAKSASSLIVDIAVESITAGEVRIYPLVSGGIETPVEVIEAVEASLNDDKVRPLCDTVVVVAPTKIDYSLQVELTLIEGSVDADLIELVTAALTVYTDKRKNKLGLDATEDQIKSICMLENVYGVILIDFTDVVVENTEYAYCTSIEVTVGGYNVG